MLEKVFASFLIRNRKQIGSILLTVVGGFLFLIILIPTVLFGGFDESDPYLQAWKWNECSDDTIVILQDIRAMDAYLEPDSFESITKEEAYGRMNLLYLNASYDKNHKKTCLLKDQNTIIKNLKQKYTMSDEQVQELIEHVEQVRNGRQYLINPIENGLLRHRYDDTIKGWIIEGVNGHEVRAAADGEITDIKTVNERIPYQKGYNRGLTVTIKHRLQMELGEDGEYKIEELYVKYSMLKQVGLSVGEKVEQSQSIGLMNQEVMLLEILDGDGNEIDPQYYLSTGSNNEKLTLPFDFPITITSEVGGRDLDDYHYGMDIVKAVDEEIRVLADGEIININRTCAPYGGSLGSLCPTNGTIPGGGNYVQIKFDYQVETYYATYMHMAEVKVQTGDIVHAGDIIGTQGHSGNSSGSHLHLEIHKGVNRIADKESLVDPRELLDFGE